MKWLPLGATVPLRARISKTPIVPLHPWPGFESKEHAKIEREYRVNALVKEIKKLDKSSPRRKLMLKLRKVLHDCCEEERCGSSACSEFRRQDRWEWLCLMLSLWPDEPTVLALLKFVTLLHEEWVVPVGKLHTFEPRKITDRLRKQLQRMGFKGVIIGGVDVDFDPDREVWVLHLHLIVEGLTTAVEQKLRELYRPSKEIPRPMMVQPVRDARQQFSYAIKSFPKCRVSYVDDEGRTNTSLKRRRVPEPHHTEWLLWTHRQPVSDLMMLMGVRRYGGLLQRGESCQRGRAEKRPKIGGNDRHSHVN